MTQIRNRIRELRLVPAKELIPNAKNWRNHPKGQRAALNVIMQEIGYADALVAYENDDGNLVLIDGHMRAEETGDQEVPVLVLDVNETEAELLLATLDPVSAMAEADLKALNSLVRELSEDADHDLQQVLIATEALYPLKGGTSGDPEPVGQAETPGGAAPQGHGEFVIVTFRLTQEEYDDKAPMIQTMAEDLNITPYITTV